MRIKALTEKMDAIVEQMETMTASAVDDNGEERAFSEEEQATFNDLQEKATNLKNTIEAEERARDLELKPVEQKVEEKKEMTIEERAIAEERAFADYLRGVVSEERAAGDVNMAKADGAATIPTTIANKIITKVWDICPIAARATRYNAKGTLSIPYYPATVSGATPDLAMAYAAEFSELESTSGKFTSIDLQAFLAGVLTKVSKSLVNNSQFDIVGFVVDHMAENIARWLEKECLVGTANKITGLAAATQTKEAAAAAAVTADELIDLQGMVKDAFQPNACWIMAPSTRDAIRKLKDREDRYLLLPDYREGFGYTLLGKPVFVSDNMPALGAGNKEIFYGDMSGLALKFSEDINIEVLRERFATEHAIGVVGYLECDAKIENEQKIAVLVGKAS
jgi:HK97 family phage major capsid protein